MGITGLVRHAVVLRMIIDPILQLSLHRNDAVERHEQLNRRAETTGAMLQNAVKRTNAHIAHKDRPRDGGHGNRRVPPVQCHGFENQSRNNRSDQGQYAQGRVDHG